MSYTTSPITLGASTQTVSSTAVPLSGIPTAANAADIYTSADIRIWTNGALPTASAGMLIDAGVTITLQSRSEIDGFRAIAVSGDATLAVEYKDWYVK